jgi:hypothetical protein
MAPAQNFGPSQSALDKLLDYGTTPTIEYAEVVYVPDGGMPDPLGSGGEITAPASAEWSDEVFIYRPSIPDIVGSYTLTLRVKYDNGLWAHHPARTFQVLEQRPDPGSSGNPKFALLRGMDGTGEIAEIEYIVSQFGQNESAPMGEAETFTSALSANQLSMAERIKYTLPTVNASLPDDTYQVAVRVKDTAGLWSQTPARTFRRSDFEAGLLGRLTYTITEDDGEGGQTVIANSEVSIPEGTGGFAQFTLGPDAFPADAYGEFNISFDLLDAVGASSSAFDGGLVGFYQGYSEPTFGSDATGTANDPMAWSANAGWVNFTDETKAGVSVTESYLSGHAWNANTGWIRLGNPAPEDGKTFSNTGDDHGVNHNGVGLLSGFGWSPNTGWVNFDWAAGNDPNAPRFDLLTGAFQGYAWSPNVGWLYFGTGSLASDQMHIVDLDRDGISDQFEREVFGDLGMAGVNSDYDGDGVSDAAEFIARTDVTDSGSYLKVTEFLVDTVTSSTEATLIFTSSDDRLYQIFYADDLSLADPWSPATLGKFVGEVGSTTKVITLPETTHKFYQVRAYLPLNESN